MSELRRGWTTGACATAATKAAVIALWDGGKLDHVQITLPRGETPSFALKAVVTGADWAEASVIKDAGDDPDVTHCAEIVVRVRQTDLDGVTFKAGAGVGTVTKPGLPIEVGEPAINPVPRAMMEDVVVEEAVRLDRRPSVEIEVSVVGGEALAAKTWNPRLGIKGGLSILGTTGIVRPYSCAAWIASIHRGIDVARADGLSHVAACTGSTSERVVQAELGLPDHAMLDMGDFAGGVLKYLAKHPIARLTIGGGFGKLTKFAQGALDLHSSRSQVDFDALSDMAQDGRIKSANTAMEAVELVPTLATKVADAAKVKASEMLDQTQVDILVISRDGRILGRAP